MPKFHLSQKDMNALTPADLSVSEVGRSPERHGEEEEGRREEGFDII